MKQNPAFCFMITPNSLIIRYLSRTFLVLLMLCFSGSSVRAEEQAPYISHFNPAKGFKPAQRSLADIFLQMAGSFEHFGTPEPYIRHVMAEHDRIDAKYKKATGKGSYSRPNYLTDEYVENLLAGWNKLAPVLTLESLSRQSGRNMRYAIMGSWNMSVGEMIAVEDKLTPQEAIFYRKLLEKPWFEKSDFPALEAFYEAGYEKLTESGKTEMSKRIWLGKQTPEKLTEAVKIEKGGSKIVTILNEYQKKSITYLYDSKSPKTNSSDLEASLISQLHLNDDKVNYDGLKAFDRDALFYSHEIRTGFMKRINHIHNQAKLPGQADSIEKALIAILKELIVFSQMEFELALDEGRADQK
jgi:hypothetical protein